MEKEMSETKFTKGEWVFSDDGTDSIVNTELDLHICSLYSRVDDFNHDANLIASAPDMYAMLESLREDYGLLTDAGKDIDKLLAKARGENATNN